MNICNAERQKHSRKGKPRSIDLVVRDTGLLRGIKEPRIFAGLKQHLIVIRRAASELQPASTKRLEGFR